MKHEQFKELLHLSFHGELSEDEHALLKEHLGGCSECRAEAAELERLDGILSKSPRLEVSDALLNEARRQLRTALREERMKRSAWTEFTEWIDELLSPAMRLALGGAMILVVGVSLGYVVFGSFGEPGALRTLPGISQASMQHSDPRISNFHIVSRRPESSEVEFSFDMVTPVRMRGNVNDPSVQKVMAQALLSDQNPGARLQTVSALSNQMEREKNPDKEIKAALIQAMKADANVGVRREALRAIQKFELDKETKDALLFVLRNESNPGIRIEVINFLEKPVLASKTVDPEILNSLKQSMQSDNNNYIRIRAKNIYEEVNQQ
ncbi:MAG TPA: HEAT repeat domain-containing protein [Bacteroidota bacterium]|nr:HEAT repeat domain-containing protein [Bacteroidota bacterium]